MEHRCNACEVKAAHSENLAAAYPDRRLPAGVMLAVTRRRQPSG